MISNHKKIFMISAIAAVVLCTLPLLVKQQPVIYVNSEHELTSVEQQFLSDLKTNGIKLIRHQKKFPTNAYVLWFYPPEQAIAIQDSSSEQINFIYSDAYYPFEWKGGKELPIMLTPHQKLYEHYMRSNIKSAVLDIKFPNAAARFIEIYQWIKENH